jgi:outer membrane protein, heavy metal efflux system
MRKMLRLEFVLLLPAVLICCLGCETSRQQQVRTAPSPKPTPIVIEPPPAKRPVEAKIQLASHQQAGGAGQLPSPHLVRPEMVAPVLLQHIETLPDLELAALANNPTLRRMQQEAAAEWAQVGYVGKLPDPTVSGMFFGDAMNFVPDRQLAEVQYMQMIPWIGRLKAEVQMAHFEALVAENQYQAERLRVVGEIRATWYKLYVLGKQISTTQADQAQLESLIKTANARVAAGDAQPGDVLMATLELSSLQEQLLSYKQQMVATTAELNRLIGRESRTPIGPPTALDVQFPTWDHDLLHHIAMSAQPELNAARLRTAATRWGIEVARLKRRPDVSVGAGWMVMAADPGDTSPGAGNDAWTLNVSSTLPIWHRKYDAMVTEATRQHYAAHATEDEVSLKIDATLRDLWEQARAAQQTIELYEKSILPQARQTFEADQKSLINGNVTFDRVIRDYRTLLNLELGYHRALGQLATTLARIRQTVGVDLLAMPETPPPVPMRPEAH